jgi:kynurenine formamidase
MLEIAKGTPDSGEPGRTFHVTQLVKAGVETMWNSNLRIPSQLTKRILVILAIFLAILAVRTGVTKTDEPPSKPGWKQGKGWGWIWGADDEVGSLNAMNNATRAKALRLATQGAAYDLGQTYSRRSFKFAGHSPGEILSFRSPEGLHRMRDPDAIPDEVNPASVRWHSCALFISDNIATQIDGLAHITAGEDHHWYNGFNEADWGGDFGVRKCDVTTIPPIVARGVLVDVAAFKRLEVLPAHYAITADDLKATLAWEGVDIEPGDVVLVRTGTGRLWGEEGADHARLAEHDSAGCDLEATRWLVETKGAMLVGSDTSGFEVAPAPGTAAQAIPVHKYLLVDQGVHIAEFHNLEALSRDRAYLFCYVASTNKIKGTVAGTALRPLALR